MDHLQACPYCPRYGEEIHGCMIYSNENLDWVNRRGGCPGFPFRDLPQGMTYADGKIMARGRVGQQKQKRKR